MIFTSDNASGAAPEIMAAVAEAEADYAMPYGNDDVTARAQQKLRDVFEAPEAIAEEVRALIVDRMENAMQLTVPLKADSSIAKNWFEGK